MGKKIRERNIRKYYRKEFKKRVTHVLEIFRKYGFWSRVNISLCLIFHPKKWNFPRYIIKAVFVILCGPAWLFVAVVWGSWHVILIIYRSCKWIWKKIRPAEKITKDKNIRVISED